MCRIAWLRCMPFYVEGENLSKNQCERGLFWYLAVQNFFNCCVHFLLFFLTAKNYLNFSQFFLWIFGQKFEDGKKFFKINIFNVLKFRGKRKFASFFVIGKKRASQSIQYKRLHVWYIAEIKMQKGVTWIFLFVFGIHFLCFGEILIFDFLGGIFPQTSQPEKEEKFR